MTTTPAPAAPAAANAAGSGTTFGTGTTAGVVTRRTLSRNATGSTTRPSSPNNSAQQQPSTLQGQQPSSTTDLFSFTPFLQQGNSNSAAAQLSNNAGAHDDAEAAVQQFHFGAPPQRGRLPGPAPAVRGPAAAGSATPITTPAQTTNQTSNVDALIGAAFPPAGSSRSFVPGAQQRQADKQPNTSRAGAQGQGSTAPQNASTVSPAVSRTPSLGTALAGGPSPATSQERSANARTATTTAQNVPPTTTRADSGFLAPQGRSNSRNNTPSAISSAANPAAAPVAPTNTSNTGAKRTRSRGREGSEDEGGDSSSSTARARKAAKVKVEGPESLIIGKQSRDLLDNIGAIASERDELKHTTEGLTAKIEELEKAVATKEAELARVKRHTRDMLQKAQRSVKTAEEIKQDWAHQQASYDLAFEQLREEKNLLSDERKTLSEFLHGDGEGSLLSTKGTIESIHTEGLEAFRLVSKTLEHTRELLAKEKDNVKDAQFDRACERDRANDIATELQASVAKYELKSKEVAEMLRQVEELKAERRVLEQRETDLLASKAEAIEKHQEQKAQLEAATQREAKLRDKIEEIEKALGDKNQEIAELERRNEDIERRLASTETNLEAKQEEAEELEDTLEEQRKELKEQANEIAKLTAEKEDLQLSLEDAHKNIESHQKSITALTEHRSEATNEIRELKQKVQAYEHEQSLRQRNEAQVDVLKTQLDEARNARSQAETELNHLRLDAVSKKYLLERASDTERRLQEMIEERKTREAKLRDTLDQRDAVIQSHEHQRQSLESQLAKSRDQADKYRSEAADVTKALNEEKHLRDKTRAECDSLKRELERVTEAQHRLEEERAKGMAALLGEQQRVRKLEQDLEVVTRGRATVVARYDSKQLEVWEIELLDHADSRRYVELREQLAEKDQLNRGLSDRLNSVNMEHAATKGQLDQSRKQCANLMRSLASAQAIINSGGQNLYDRGGADVGGVGPVRTGRVPSKTRPKKSTAQAATGGGTSMPTHLGHSYRSPSSTFRSSRMSRAPSSSDSERREASESRHQSKAAGDDVERQSQQQDENQNQSLRARAPSPPSPHKNNGEGGAAAGALAESQCPDDSGVMSSTIETTTNKTPARRTAADDSQSMPPPTAAATYGRKTRRNDGGSGAGTSAGGSIDDQVSSFLAADRAASSSGGGAGGAASPSTTRKRGAGAGAGAATEFSMALGENLDDDSQDAQRVGSSSAAGGGSGRKKSEAMKGKRKAGGRA